MMILHALRSHCLLVFCLAAASGHVQAVACMPTLAAYWLQQPQAMCRPWHACSLLFIGCSMIPTPLQRRRWEHPCTWRLRLSWQFSAMMPRWAFPPLPVHFMRCASQPGSMFIMCEGKRVLSIRMPKSALRSLDAQTCLLGSC